MTIEEQAAAHEHDDGDPGAADRLTARLRAAEGQVAQLEVRLLAAEQDNARVGELEEALRSALHEIDLLKQALDEQRAVSEDLGARMAAADAAAQAEITHLRGVVGQLQGSLSWRITRPLRRLKRAARRP